MSEYRGNGKPVFDRKKIMLLIIALVIVAQIILSVVLGKYLFKKNFTDSKETTEKGITQWAYDTTYDATERSYHVSNEITLNFGEIREKADLEVLEAYSMNYYISTAQDNGKIDVWLEVPGECVFTVNMKMSEVIFDQNRHHVLIRIPSPVVSYSNIDVTDINIYRLEDEQKITSFINSIDDGEQIAINALSESQKAIIKNISSDAEYYKSAKENAIKIIQNLVKNLNPDVPGLVVDVEFL